VNITFYQSKFEKLANDDRKLLKEFGKIRADKIKIRLSQFKFANNLEELRNMPGNFHELSNRRKGQWACDLDQPYRLIFTPHENPIPTNEHGQYIWIKILGVEIIEIVDYHKEK